MFLLQKTGRIISLLGLWPVEDTFLPNSVDHPILEFWSNHPWFLWTLYSSHCIRHCRMSNCAWNASIFTYKTNDNSNKWKIYFPQKMFFGVIPMSQKLGAFHLVTKQKTVNYGQCSIICICFIRTLIHIWESNIQWITHTRWITETEDFKVQVLSFNKIW